MKSKQELCDNLIRQCGNLDETWRSLTGYNIKKEMVNALDFIRRVYPDKESLDEVIEQYNKDNFIENEYEGLVFGYTYAIDQYQEYIRNPSSLWEFYDSTKDKSIFYGIPFLRYTTDKKQNKMMYLTDVFYGIMSYFNLSEAQIRLMSREEREKYSNQYYKVFKEHGTSGWEKRHKKSYSNGVRRMVAILDRIGVLENDRELHNENMKKIGLTDFEVQPDVPAIDKEGNVFGINLESCSVFQLEAMLAFYSNRLEKYRENLGLGLFMLKEFEGQSVKSISSDQLKEAWKKYKILDILVNNVHEIVHDEWAKGNYRDPEKYQKTFNEAFEMYRDTYIKLFGGKDKKVDFDHDINLYSAVNGGNKHNNYLVKGSLMEDLLIQSVRQNANWGIMAENDGNIKMGKMVYIGIDIPGFNMPLRLHHPLSDLKDLMKNYIGEEEVPIYVGADDFIIDGSNVGTQLLFPITPKQSAAVKKIAKRKEEKPSEISKWAKHIACMQLPNMVKKLLDEKTNKKQKYPDYMNIFTRKIRRTERKEVSSPNDTDGRR